MNETVRQLLGAIHMAHVDANVAFFGPLYGGALATLANESLLEFAELAAADNPEVADACTFMAQCADETLGPDRELSEISI
jgi:hypothetical protein